MRLDEIRRWIATAPDRLRHWAGGVPAAVRLKSRRAWVGGLYRTRHSRHKVWMRFRLRLLNLGIVLRKWGDRMGRFLFATLMTLISILISAAFEIFQPTVGPGQVLDHIREVNIGCSAIAGTALVLVLTLSVIPAQKAAEAFSQAILRLYLKDRTLSLSFALFGVTCLVSLLIGTGWNAGMSPYAVLVLQFLLMGVSLDALRLFHVRTVKLLMPEIAIALVVGECRKTIDVVARHTDKVAKIMRFHRNNSANARMLRAFQFNRVPLAPSLNRWINELDEFAHKSAVRGETRSIARILTAMGQIGSRYAEARRQSIVLIPDMNNLFAGGQTEVSQLLDHIYGCIHGICQHAAKLENEQMVTSCVETLGAMAVGAMNIVVDYSDGWPKAPLVHSPVFYLDLCTNTAIGSGMQDAQLAIVRMQQAVLLSTRPDVDTRTAEMTALGCLYKIALAGTVKLDSVLGHPAMKALLHASLHDLQHRNYDVTSMLRTVLGYAQQIVPYEVVADAAYRRTLEIFPPYSMGFEANLARHLEVVAHAVGPVDPEQQWIDPFAKFLSVAEHLRDHYRELSGIDFKGTVLLHWVLDSLVTCCRVHIAALANPPEGAQNFLGGVEESLEWMAQGLGFFFRAGGSMAHSDVATGGLAKLGMELLRFAHIGPALVCGEVISRIASNCALSAPRSYDVADHLRNLEILARAADALGQNGIPDQFRRLMAAAKPDALPEDDWRLHEAELAHRINQLNEELGRFVWDHALRDDPISMLRRIRAETGADQEEDEPEEEPE